MGDIQITTDEWIFWQSSTWPAIRLNATIVFTWFVMVSLVVLSRLATRRLSSSTEIPRVQNLLEVIVTGMRDQIRDVSGQEPGPYLPLVGTLFLFIGTANLLSIVPGYRPPTGSLSTTAALAGCVLVAVPIYGIAHHGLRGYLMNYLRPTVFMLPFNIIGELSRTLALAVRLYGNMMSGTVIAAILIGFVPLFVPILMQLLGLLTGMIQAYIFAVLAMVYIASATRVQRQTGGARRRRPDEMSDNLDNRSHSNKELKMDNLGLVALGSIIMAGLTIAVGSIAPALGEGRAVAQALSAIAQQPDASNTITRTLFVGLAMVESTAIYCFVVAMILLFANPFWNFFAQQ